VVDTGALREFLAEGRIHAAVDVIDPEPLPPGDPLWDEQNLLLTPHVGGNSRVHEALGFQLIADQVERLRSGLPLLNVVNR
jgi:phosphoglycerate dehydrogenase-like enzyme